MVQSPAAEKQQPQHTMPVEHPKTPAVAGSNATTAAARDELSHARAVGREFVYIYYLCVNQCPRDLHRFYSGSSYFVHGGRELPDQPPEPPVAGQTAIAAKIEGLGLTDCRTRILMVDSLPAPDNGVLVQVCGEISNNAGPMRRFMQTFLLSPNGPNKYFVRNDIFRYQDEVFFDGNEEEEEPAAASAAAATAINDEKVHASQQPLIEAEKPASSGIDNDTGAASAIVSERDANHVAETGQVKKQEQAAAAAAGDEVGEADTAAAQAVVDESPLQPSASGSTVGKEDDDKAEQNPAQQQEEKKEKEKPLSPPPPPPPPPPPTAPGGKRNFAALFSDAVASQQQQLPQPQSPPPPSAAATAGGAAASKSVAAAKSAAAVQQQQAQVNGGQSHSGSQAASAGPAPASATAAEAPDHLQVFVGNLAPEVRESDLAAAFRHFGEVSGCRISQGKPRPGQGYTPNFGFVSFASVKSVKEAVAKPPTLNGARINVEEKKPGFRRGGGGGRGGFRGGAHNSRR